MKEDFLHYVWKYKLFKKDNLKTVDNKDLFILNSGTYNFNAGTDFLNAKIKIAAQVWAGNIEIHLKSSDWYLHHHEIDANYDATILHVVFEHDADIFRENNTKIPTLELKNLLDEKLLQQYQKLLFSKQQWIPCESEISKVDTFVLKNWTERLFFERLERKSTLIHELLKKQHSDFEAVLFQLLAKNFGLKINADAFLLLANSLDFTIVRKTWFNRLQLSALLFGQAGFLEETMEDGYHKSLKEEYSYLKHKHHLQPISKHNFSFFRMRPNNFPTIRIAQLVSLYFLEHNLFSKLMQISKMEDFYNLFSIQINDYWKTHFTFETESKKTAKNLTKSFIDLLIINTIIPLKFVYEKSRGAVNEENLIFILKQIKPEKNSIITKFNLMGVPSKSAFETQALLELKNNYCAPKRCLECAIGNTILKR